LPLEEPPVRARVLAGFDRYARACLLIGIGASALIFSRQTQDAFNLVKLTALGISVLVAFALFVSWSAERRKWVPGFFIGYAGVAFLGAYTLASYFSRNQSLSLAGRYHRYIGLAELCLYLLGGLTVVGLHWENPNKLSGIAKAFAASLILLAGYVITQAAGLDWLQLRNPGGDVPPYPIGSLGNSNFSGAYLGLGLPLLVYLVVKTRRGGVRDSLMAAVGLCVVALWLTQSRGGMIAAAFALGVMGLAYRDMVPRAARRVVGAFVVACGIAAVLIIWHPGSKTLPGPLANMAVFQTRTLEARTAYWQTAIQMFKERPLIGQGPDLFFTLYPRYRSPEDAAKVGLLIPDEPHNIFLQHLAYGGLLGLGFFAAVVALALSFGYRAARTRDGPFRLEAAAFLGVLAGYLGQGLFGIDVPPLAFVGWVAIAAIAAVADPRLKARRAGRDDLKELAVEEQTGGSVHQKYPGQPAKARVLFHVLVVILLAVEVTFALRPVTADTRVRQALRLVEAKSTAEAADKFDEAIRLAPWEPIYRSQAGGLAQRRGAAAADILTRKSFFVQAEERYRQALGLEPGNLFYVTYLARLNVAWTRTVDSGRFAEADRWWQAALALDPADWRIRQERATFMNAYAIATKDLEVGRRASEEFAQVDAIKVKFGLIKN